MKNFKNNSKLNIYSIDGCNVYIEERDENNFFIDLWEAAVNADGSIDHTMWTLIEEQETLDNLNENFFPDFLLQYSTRTCAHYEIGDFFSGFMSGF